MLPPERGQTLRSAEAWPHWMLRLDLGLAHDHNMLCSNHAFEGSRTTGSDPRRGICAEGSDPEVALSFPQHLRRINAGGPARWQPAGEHTDGAQDHCGSGERQGIVGLETVEQC